MRRGKNRAKKGCGARLSPDPRGADLFSFGGFESAEDAGPGGNGNRRVADLLPHDVSVAAEEVRLDSGKRDAPAMTSPSVAIVSPGRTTITSPTCSSSIGTSSSAVLLARQAAMSWTSPMSSLHGLRCGSGRTKEVRAEGCKINADLLQDCPFRIPRSPVRGEDFFRRRRTCSSLERTG